MRRTTSVAAGVAHLVGPGALKVVNGHLAFSQQGQPALRLDPAALTAVTCYGDVSVSGAAMELLFRHGIQTAWFTPAGTRCRGRLARTDSPTTLARVRQHRALARPEARLAWAKAVVAGKIDAMSAAARHYQRHGSAHAGALLARLTEYATRVPAVPATEQLLGLEGAASAAWFEFFATLVRAPWSFPARSRRPPADPLNALLSLGYTWLLNRAAALAEARGFELYLGGLHEYRAGRPSLACDLIEPLRVPAVDRWSVAVCGRDELRPTDFRAEEAGGFRLIPSAFARTLHSWETHWVSTNQENDLVAWLGRFDDVLKVWADLPESAEQSDSDL